MKLSGPDRRRGLRSGFLTTTIAALMLAVPATSQAAFGSVAPVSLASLGGGGRGLGEATSVALSPDGRNAYVASQSNSFPPSDSGVAVFARDAAGGGLSQLAGTAGCNTVTGADGTLSNGMTCRAANGVDGAKAAVVSPDGKFVYVVGSQVTGPNPGSDGAIAIFSRDASTGALTQAAGTAGCIGSGESSACASGAPDLADADALTISPDGRFLYASAGEGNTALNSNGAVSVFSRDVGTGLLTQVQCLEYVPNGTASSPGCTVARALREPEALALSPGAGQLYVAASEGGSTDGDGAVVTLNRDATTGLLTQPAGAAGCIDATGTDDTTISGTVCATGRAVHDAHSVIVSPDGASVYVAAQGESSSSGSSLGAVDAFTRNGTTGTIAQLPGTSGCITADGSNGYSVPSPGTCTVGRALFEPSGVAVSPDGLSVYVASADPSSSLDVFARDPASSGLSQLPGVSGCITEDGGDGNGATCAQAAGLAGANGLAVAAGSVTATCSFVYVAAQDSQSALGFARQPDCTPPAPPPPSPTAPVVTTGTATGLSLHGATLNGTVNPRGGATTYRFDYGLTSGYGAQTLPVNAGSGSTPGAASTKLNGLQDGVVYHYRIEATNAGGTTVGQDRTFTTSLPGRIKPKRISVNVKPGRFGGFPVALTTSGRLFVPAVGAKRCSGFVRIGIKHGKTTVSSRRVKLSRRCTYRSKVTIRSQRRLGGHGRLKVSARFLGNRFLAPKGGPTRSVRYG
ncbi:MAG: hypothetical protein ACRDNK_06830, partial [Solirubrobacteraceae bacterium]